LGIAQHGAADDADAEHIEPALAEIEQMRIDQRGQKILHDDDGADPGHQSGAAKQQNMGGPHRQQHRGAEDTELDRHGENLAVRIDRGHGRGGTGVAGREKLCRLVQDVLELREYYTRTRNVRVELDIAPDLPFLAVNEDELKQILLNLVNNSSDALEGMPGTKQLSIRGYQSGLRAVIEVEDTGPGFGNLNRALDPFYTTKPVGKGTGLGLSVCYGIVKERGGDLRIENVEPHGARVTIELPLAEATVLPLVAVEAHA